LARILRYCIHSAICRTVLRTVGFAERSKTHHACNYEDRGHDTDNNPDNNADQHTYNNADNLIDNNGNSNSDIDTKHNTRSLSSLRKR
ncbi:jg351, partial [Pararge aegeria aegeria]